MKKLQIHTAKSALSLSSVDQTAYLHVKKIKIYPDLSPCTKFNSKQIDYQNIRPCTLKVVNEKMKNTFVPLP